MMQELRNFSKAFLIFVVIAFIGSIIFAWGMDIGQGSQAKGYIAEVNGEEIDPQIYDNYLNNFTMQLNQNGRIHLDWDVVVQIRQSAWEQMIMDIVLRQHIQDLGLTVSDRELFEYLYNYPPRYLWSEQAFQTEGRFDIQKYREFLADPNFANQVAYIEQQEEPNILRYQWNELLRSTIQITPEELMREFKRSNEQMKIDYAFVSTRLVEDPPPFIDSLAVIEFYNEHKEEYKRDAQANLEYVAFDVYPSASDSSDISDLKIWIQQATEAEEDIFPMLAAIVSDDTRSQQTRGDIGWVQRGRYSPEFDSAAFALDSGEITQEPVKTFAGWHILKCYGKRTTEEGVEEVKLSQIVKKIRPSGDTFSQYSARANTFKEELKESTFEEIASKYNKEILETGQFFEGTTAGKLGTAEEANEFAFEHRVGKISDVIMVANLDQNTYKFIIARVKERLPERILPLEEAHRFALTDYRRKVLLDKADSIATLIYDEAEKTLDLKTASEKHGGEYIQTEFFTRRDVRQDPRFSDPQFMGAVFSMNNQNRLSEPVYTNNGVAVIMFTGRVFNPDQFDMNRETIYKNLWSQKVQETTQEYAQQLLDEAEIQDYRRLDYKWFF
ncbi:MAG: hypothetical protein GWO41_12120 [candidate division Zixibacteria bacterium]|nr:hypothetical protein [candidate division Zixibacteria bacterium]NIR63243.1 hypothetical protein [candidate division Zixibacteria bacterium]NIS17103.1 hypothetical protein [candidate division Zixibacteria bacterium]NIS45224.1 hypothetical protein [candidate division Zixibacteria bacterium]NIT53455.1 hypothetical protein [candidate division Zixibacteria bacterium]